MGVDRTAAPGQSRVGEQFIGQIGDRHPVTIDRIES